MLESLPIFLSVAEFWTKVPVLKHNPRNSPKAMQT